MKSRTNLAFVVQRCGEEVIGGAESLCLQIAERMSEHCSIQVLTTCARDYRTWRNHYPAGHTRVRGIHVMRFPVDAPRDIPSFDARSRRLRDRLEDASLSEQEAWMRAQGPISSPLNAYLDPHQQRFSNIAFFGYLYATSYLLLPKVAHKAVLWPFLHDEWPLRLSMWDSFFTAPHHLVMSSSEESELLGSRFPNLEVPRTIVPVGITPPPHIDAERFRQRYNVSGSFMLYLGRIDPSKGCDALIAHVRKYCSESSNLSTLVLIGTQHMELPHDPRILVLGPVDEGTKWDALAACDIVVMPSPHESLSLTVLEAWASGKPVLVNGNSTVLVGQCRRANGGVWYSTYEEFAASLDLLTSDLRLRLGEQGRAYVDKHYLWDDAVAAYQYILC